MWGNLYCFFLLLWYILYVVVWFILCLFFLDEFDFVVVWIFDECDYGCVVFYWVCFVCDFVVLCFDFFVGCVCIVDCYC